METFAQNTIKPKYLLNQKLPEHFQRVVTEKSVEEAWKIVGEHKTIRNIFNGRQVHPSEVSPIVTLLYLNALGKSEYLKNEEREILQYLDFRLTYFKSAHTIQENELVKEVLRKIVACLTEIYNAYKDDYKFRVGLQNMYCSSVSDLLLDFFRLQPSKEELEAKLEKGSDKEKKLLIQFFSNLINQKFLEPDQTIGIVGFVNAYFPAENRKKAEELIKQLMKKREIDAKTLVKELISLSNGKFKIPYQIHYKYDEALLDLAGIKKDDFEKILESRGIKTEGMKLEQAEQKEETTEELLMKYTNNIYNAEENLSKLLETLATARQHNHQDFVKLIKDQFTANLLTLLAAKEYADKEVATYYKEIGRFFIHYYLFTGMEEYINGFKEFINEKIRQAMQHPQKIEEIGKQINEIIKSIDELKQNIVYSQGATTTEQNRVHNLENLQTSLGEMVNTIKK